jgi:hypothetical protein
MNKGILLAFAVLAAVALTGSTALALAPMGTTTPEVNAGQFLLGADYSWARTDVKVEDSSGHIRTNTYLAKLGYGICDEWEVYGRFGLGNVRAEDFAGHYESAGGFGTKVNFYKWEDFDWGVIYQMTWLYSRDDVSDVSVKMKPWDAEIAIGPTYKPCDCFSIYGGPYMEIMRGKITALGETARINNILIGVYLGTEVKLCQCSSVHVEMQFAQHNSFGISTGITYKF